MTSPAASASRSIEPASVPSCGVASAIAATLARDDPARLARGGRDLLGVRLGLGQQQLDELTPARLTRSGGGGLRRGIAGDRLTRELVDVGEDRFREQPQGVRIGAAGRRGGAERVAKRCARRACRRPAARPESVRRAIRPPQLAVDRRQRPRRRRRRRRRSRRTARRACCTPRPSARPKRPSSGRAYSGDLGTDRGDRLGAQRLELGRDHGDELARQRPPRPLRQRGLNLGRLALNRPFVSWMISRALLDRCETSRELCIA